MRLPGVALLIAALTCTVTSAAAREGERFKGRSLAEALQLLQAEGLRIVFSSATVTPGMRVTVEPRAAAAREQLDELLAPHGLRTRNGPGGILEIMRIETTRRTAGPVGSRGQTPARRTDSSAVDATTTEATAGGTVYHEYVAVTEPAPQGRDRGVAAQTNLDRRQFDGVYGSLADDPMRLVHALPHVAPADEFRSEFAVRGSPFRHVDVVVDGISTHWLTHTTYDRGATGSVAMLPPLAIESATLRAGAYPRRHGDRLGPQLDLTIREGSRSEFGLRGAIGGASATLLGEGPVGASSRGSWLAAFRQSYLEWPAEQAGTRTPFGFIDGLAKVVYDVRANQQVAVSVLGGRSAIDADDHLGPTELGNGMNRALAVNLSWRSAISPALVVRQRASMVRHHFVNKHQTGRTSDRGAHEQLLYRADVVRPVGDALLEFGAQIGRMAIDDVPRTPDAEAITGSSWARSAYAHVAWAATPTLTLSPGARITAFTHAPHLALTHWLLSEWAFRPGWTLNASVGASDQLPELRHVVGRAGATDPRAERARYVDVGLELQLTGSIRWQATVFLRREDDILREPDLRPRAVGDLVIPPERRYANALRGAAHGVELLLDRRSPTGLSGWAAYSYGKTRYDDVERGEQFWGDFDQRHALTLFGRARLSPRTSVGATFRAGSNFPIPGYLLARDGGLFIGAERNRLRLPAYARLDVRGDRRFDYFRRHLTVFAEMLNVLNRANAGLAGGSVDTITGEATGLTDSLLGRRASVGVLIEF
jgi:hypothetical protein